jgi:hypothetical protein
MRNIIPSSSALEQEPGQRRVTVKIVAIGGAGPIGSRTVKRILCWLLVVSLPFGIALADAPKSKTKR